MPLKKSEVKKSKTFAGEVGQTLRFDALQSLFVDAKLPGLTLNINQFAFPANFLVKEVKTVDEYEMDEKTGWNLKQGDRKIPTGEKLLKFKLADGELAQSIVDAGGSLAGMPTVDMVCHTVHPLQDFEPDETLVELVKPVIGLGFNASTSNCDRLVIYCDDVKEV